jgi:opacity protein-like surface antigen
MKKFLIAMTLISLNAYASEPLWKKFYFRADGGGSFPLKTHGSAKLETIPFYGGGLGFKFNEFFRSDLNIQMRNNKAVKEQLYKKIDNTSIWLNNVFNLTDFEDMTPYLTFGVGISSNKVKSYHNPNFADGLLSVTTIKKTEKGIAWNIGAGTTYKLANHVHFDFSYKFTNLGQFKNEGFTISNLTSTKNSFKDKGKLRAHELLAGFIITLN